MRRFLLIALLALPAQADRFTSERCQASFDLPDKWIAKVIEGKRCSFGLRPTNWKPVEDGPLQRNFGEWAITIKVEHRPFEEAARKGLFTREEDGWYLHGRMASRDKATWMRSDHWFGVKGSTTVGYHSDERGYEGLDTLWRAVLSNGRWRTATIEAAHPFSGAEFEQIVKSFRFE